MVLQINASYWQKHPDLARSLLELVKPLLEPGFVYTEYPIGEESPLDQRSRSLIAAFTSSRGE
jgi:hypothetical protein